MSLVSKRWSFAVFAAMAGGFVAGFWGCSCDSDKMAGNSAETGSPELASIEGSLFLQNGRPAALARLTCIPSAFDVFEDTVYIWGESDENGIYSLKNVKPGNYSLEAFDQNSGERLLVQNIAVGDSSVTAIDTLKAPGFALLKLDSSVTEGASGVASVIGTTIYRNFKVSDGIALVDSLPAGDLDLRLIFDGDEKVFFDGVKVDSKDTVKIGFPSEPVVPVDTIPADSVEEDSFAVIDTLIMRFVAPMALPEGSIDSLVDFVSDIPLALRLTPENCNFDTLAGMDGRWQVRRIKTDGGASKQLPIANAYFDSVAQEAVFWVSIDSLNLDDSLELVFDNTLTPAFARDVFPTNRSYTAVWHFDDGVAPVTDAAEKKNFPGTATGAVLTDGVVGSGISMKVDSYVIAESSAEANAELHSDFIYDVLELFNFSLWIRLDDLSKEQVVFEKSDKEYSLRFDPKDGFVVEIFHIATEVPADSGAKDTLNYNVRWSSGIENLVAGEWTYVAFSKHGFSKAGNGQGSLFVNDRKVEAFVKSAWDGKRGSAVDFKLGGFAGSLDEFMVGDSFRDDSWTYLTYLNQKPVDFWPQLAPEK